MGRKRGSTAGRFGSGGVTPPTAESRYARQAPRFARRGRPPSASAAEGRDHGADRSVGEKGRQGLHLWSRGGHSLLKRLSMFRAYTVARRKTAT